MALPAAEIGFRRQHLRYLIAIFPMLCVFGMHLVAINLPYPSQAWAAGGNSALWKGLGRWGANASLGVIAAVASIALLTQHRKLQRGLAAGEAGEGGGP